MNKQNRDRLITQRAFDPCPVGEGLRGQVKTVKGRGGADWQLQNSQGDVERSMGSPSGILGWLSMVSEGRWVYWDNHLVSCVVSDHQAVHLKLTQCCMSTVTEKLQII